MQCSSVPTLASCLVPSLTACNFPSDFTRHPIAARYSVSKHPNYEPKIRLEPPIIHTTAKHSEHSPAPVTFEMHTEKTETLCKLAWIQNGMDPFRIRRPLQSECMPVNYTGSELDQTRTSTLWKTVPNW